MNSSSVSFNFLPESFYKELKETLPPPPTTRGTRSHHDRYHVSPEWDSLPEPWLKLRELCTSREFWEKIVSRFAVLDGYKLDLFDAKANEGVQGNQIPNRPVQYPRCDLGYGGVGYGRINGGFGAHRDFKRRVISCLLYFTDQSELQGGEVQLHNRRDKVMFCLGLRENMLVACVQDEHGWHSVRPVNAVKSFRHAVYIGLSDTRKKQHALTPDLFR